MAGQVWRAAAGGSYTARSFTLPPSDAEHSQTGFGRRPALLRCIRAYTGCCLAGELEAWSWHHRRMRRAVGVEARMWPQDRDDAVPQYGDGDPTGPNVLQEALMDDFQIEVSHITTTNHAHAPD